MRGDKIYNLQKIGRYLKWHPSIIYIASGNMSMMIILLPHFARS